MNIFSKIIYSTVGFVFALVLFYAPTSYAEDATVIESGDAPVTQAEEPVTTTPVIEEDSVAPIEVQNEPVEDGGITVQDEHDLGDEEGDGTSEAEDEEGADEEGTLPVTGSNKMIDNFMLMLAVSLSLFLVALTIIRRTRLKKYFFIK